MKTHYKNILSHAIRFIALLGLTISLWYYFGGGLLHTFAIMVVGPIIGWILITVNKTVKDNRQGSGFK